MYRCVKTFSMHDLRFSPDRLDKQVNQWIMDNKVKVVDMKFTATDESPCDYLFVHVIYKVENPID